MATVRSNDWWRLPREEDIRPASDIHSMFAFVYYDLAETSADLNAVRAVDLDYGDAKSSPPYNVNDMCSW